MKTFTVPLRRHRIEIARSFWSDKQTVHYDGRLVSSKRSYLFVTPHSFQVEEDGSSVTYEVDLLRGLMGQHGYVVRKDGIILAHEP